MATAPRPQHLEEDFTFDAGKAKLPGYTVDALLAEGKIEEARAELERLVLEGIDSGPGMPMTNALFEEIITGARSRSASRSK